MLSISTVSYITDINGDARRFATTCLLYGAAFHLWSSLLFLQFDGDIEPDSLESIDTPSKRDVSPPGKDHVIPEQSTFIPLGLPHIQPGALYAPSDAEWGRFVKMAADKQRLRSLRGKHLLPNLITIPRLI